MRIVIQTVPHKAQRYDTIGDWYTDRVTGTVHIEVSKLGNWRYELLVAVHELVEAFLCLQNGVLEESVNQFDKQFGGEGEPGDDRAAPYQLEHSVATGFERLLAALLRVNWNDYEDTLSLVSKEWVPNERPPQDAT